MTERVFGLSVNEVMAYAAVANLLLVVILTAINIYYAWHAKRQADASKAQVQASNRQASLAEESLAILRKQIEQQHRADLATVTLQLKIAIHAIDDWMKRIAGDAYPQLPHEISILSDDFSVATHRANAIDEIVAENMGAAALYIVESENNLRILRARQGDQPEGWKDVQEKAHKSLNIAKYKLNVARARWETVSSSNSAG
jgi:hypothetical protein